MGYSKVQSSYELIINILNNITKDNIVLDWDYNSKLFKNYLNFENFNKSLNNKYLLLNNDFENTKKNIYHKYLQREIYKIEERSRNLENKEAKVEKENEIKYNISDKAINDNFQNIY